MDKCVNQVDKLRLSKNIKLKEKELKKREENLFLDEIKLENDYKTNLQDLKEKEKFELDFKRLFIIEMY